MTTMGSLIAACATFVGSHFLLSHPLRDPMVRRMGEAAFRGIYSLVALLSFAWVVLAYRAAPAIAPSYVPGPIGWGVATALMLVASVLLAGSFFGNPALPSPHANAAATRNALGTMAVTRHPMMWSFAIWSLVHILIWPTWENHVLATSILLLSLGGAFGQDMKKARLMGDSWRGWVRRTSFVPFTGQLSGRISWGAAWPGWGTMVLGIGIWLLATWLHGPLGGRMPAGIWYWLS